METKENGYRSVLRLFMRNDKLYSPISISVFLRNKHDFIQKFLFSFLLENIQEFSQIHSIVIKFFLFGQNGRVIATKTEAMKKTHLV